MSRMGCPDISKRDIKNAKDAINRALHQACECATESCECRDIAVQAQIGAQASQVSASNSANQAQAAWNDFQTRYLGAFPTAPVTTIVGALYFNTVSNEMFVWSGVTWISVASGAIIPDGDKGDITVSGAGTIWTVDNGLAGTKINPNFGSQNITTTGNIGVGTPATSYKGDFLGNSNALIGIRVYNQSSNSNAETVVQVGNDTNSAAAALRLNSSTNIASGGPNALSLINGLNAPIVLSTNLTERVRVEGDGDVGIGTTPTASAILDVSSTTKGFLPPRMTTTQRDAIPSPAEGLVVYNTTTDEINVFNGTAWASAGGGVSSFSAGTTGLTPSTATTGAITLAGTLAIANGGTGATTASGARTNLSAVGSDITGIGGATQLTNMMQITQAGYNAITPNANTLYVIVG